MNAEIKTFLNYSHQKSDEISGERSVNKSMIVSYFSKKKNILLKASESSQPDDVRLRFNLNRFHL